MVAGGGATIAGWMGCAIGALRAGRTGIWGGASSPQSSSSLPSLAPLLSLLEAFFFSPCSTISASPSGYPSDGHRVRIPNGSDVIQFTFFVPGNVDSSKMTSLDTKSFFFFGSYRSQPFIPGLKPTNSPFRVCGSRLPRSSL